MIYVQIQRFRDGVLPWVIRSLEHRGPKHLKLVGALERGPIEELLGRYPDLVIWYRRYWPAGDQHLEPAEYWAALRSDEILRALDESGCRPYVRRVSGYNEIAYAGAKLRAVEVKLARRMNAEGLDYIWYQMSVGQPDKLDDWPQYLPAEGLPLDGSSRNSLSLHQYHRPQLWTEHPVNPDWTLFRHEKVRERTGYRGWIDLGEFGVDLRTAGGTTLGGWQHAEANLTASQYCEQLEWAAARLARDGRVRAFLFVGGHFSPWGTFEVCDHLEIAEALARIGNAWAHLAAQPAPVPGAGGDTVVQPDSIQQLGPGFRELYEKAKQYTGEPLEAEWSVTKAGEPGGAIFQTVRFERGTAYWNRRGNFVLFAGDDGWVVRVRAGRVRVLTP